MKKLTAIVLALLLVLSLCACSGGGSTDTKNVEGTYTLYAMDYDGTPVLATELFEGENYVTLKSGGKAEMSMEGDIANITWKMDGSKLTLHAADGDMDGSIKDGILTLVLDDSNLYFLGDTADKNSIKALTLDELLSGMFEDPAAETPEEPAAETNEKPVFSSAPAAGPSELQKQWNGWYYGCVDMSDCTGEWEFLNGNTYDAVMYVELDKDGEGRLAIYDPFGSIIANEQNNIYADAQCHADEQYLYCDSGTVFNNDLNPSDWRFVHNTVIPEKLHVGSESTDDNGEKVGYEFQFKPWGDRWEDDAYTTFIPYFDSYIDAIDAGLTTPFGDTFTGFGIAETAAESEPSPAPSATPAAPSTTPAAPSSGGLSPLLGSNPEKLDVNDRGIVNLWYPADKFYYDDTYDKLKNDDAGVGILIDTMLGENNFDELKASYEKNNSDEEDYSLVETTVNGYKAQIMKYSDWLGSTMRVDVNFGGNHDGWYGISFVVTGDSLKDCDTDLVWAVIESMEVLK